MCKQLTCRRRFVFRTNKGYPYHGRAACLFATIDWSERGAFRRYDECLRLVQQSMEADRRERRAPCVLLFAFLRLPLPICLRLRLRMDC